jgi:uridine phosphorylase
MTKGPPILCEKHYGSATIFKPENLLREAPRQKGLAPDPVPEICLLDPDGDILRALRAEGRARAHAGWACYHTEFWVAELGDLSIGIVGCAVGAAFAVLVAEQLFASGCRLLVSVTSAGQITAAGPPPPYFVLIERALRDEGTSYHYMPPTEWSEAEPRLLAALDGAFEATAQPVLRGAAWTTDAPFRETEEAVRAMRARGILAVEMEAAALYALARSHECSVVCFAHVTNQMGQVDGDFEKGSGDGAFDALEVVRRTVDALIRPLRRL